MNVAIANAGAPSSPTASLLPATAGSAGPCAERGGSESTSSFADSLALAKQAQQGSESAQAPASADEQAATDAPADADGKERDSRMGGKRSSRDDEATPDLSAWLPGWTPPPTPVPRADGPDPGTGSVERDPRDVPVLGGHQNGKALTHGTLASGTSGEIDTSRPDARAESSGPAPSIFEGTDKSLSAASSAPTDPRAQDAMTSSAISHPAPPSTFDTSPASRAAPFEARLSAHISSPEFAPALGVQLSVLAREGVHEARLHLHPAEMGPISVQIALQGTQ
ncbi:MAG TPA: hypothetical protein VFP68_05405, partial [Burkholderiaceae bacterium]|nr:hypothetical protein [Burkholderiaceae bacterium]